MGQVRVQGVIFSSFQERRPHKEIRKEKNGEAQDLTSLMLSPVAPPSETFVERFPFEVKTSTLKQQEGGKDFSLFRGNNSGIL
jgi:hypothetical protein